GQLVSGDFFRTMGVKAAVGHVLEASDDSPTAAPVAVLNYRFWQSSFGGARDVVGRTIELNGVAFTIDGVAEQRFTGIAPGSDYDVWLPLSAGPRITNPMMWSSRQDSVTYWWLTIVARLKTETPLPKAQTAISGLFRNEMLFGSVPLFDEGGMFGPVGPRGGGGPARSQTMIGGPGPGPAGPGPSTGGPRTAQAPAGSGPRDGVVVQGPMATPGNGPQPGKIQGPAVAKPAAQGQAPAEATSEARTLSKPDDEPTITLVNAQT